MSSFHSEPSVPLPSEEELTDEQIEEEVANSEAYLYGPEEGWFRRFLERFLKKSKAA